MSYRFLIVLLLMTAGCASNNRVKNQDIASIESKGAPKSTTTTSPTVISPDFKIIKFPSKDSGLLVVQIEKYGIPPDYINFTIDNITHRCVTNNILCAFNLKDFINQSLFNEEDKAYVEFSSSFKNFDAEKIVIEIKISTIASRVFLITVERSLTFSSPNIRSVNPLRLARGKLLIPDEIQSHSIFLKAIVDGSEVWIPRSSGVFRLQVAP